jgi:hypothetical protein
MSQRLTAQLTDGRHGAATSQPTVRLGHQSLGAGLCRPLGNDHRHYKQWRCDLRLYADENWLTLRGRTGHVFDVDKLATASTPPPSENAGPEGMTRTGSDR